MGLLFGDGTGNVQKQTLFSTEKNTNNSWLRVGDFNGDRYQSIVIVGYISIYKDILFNTYEHCTAAIFETGTILYQ